MIDAKIIVNELTIPIANRESIDIGNQTRFEKMNQKSPQLMDDTKRRHPLNPGSLVVKIRLAIDCLDHDFLLIEGY